MIRLNHDSSCGFTLLEFIIVMTLIGILSSVLFNMIRGPMQAFVAVKERATLVDIVDTALQRMTREIRLVLPYSIRVSSSTAVEFLRTVDGGRYREQGLGRLRFNVDSDTFSVLNALANPGGIQTGSGPAACINGTADCLVVFNIGQPKTVVAAAASGLSANAYLGTSVNYDGNIATISAALANSLSFDNSGVGPPPWRFGMSSPQQRFHIVDTPVSYVCSAGQITRYSGYPIQDVQPVPPASGGNLLIDQVTGCDFTYSPPSSTKFGLLTMRIEVTDPGSGQSVALIQQVHVSNIP